MIVVVIDTAPVRPWADVVVATPLLPTTTTMTAVVPLVAIALDVMTTADALHRASSMIGVREAMDALRHVVVWEDLMSMVHRAPDTLTILTMPGPDHLPVATKTPT
jgi:hypothetical protein